MNTRNLTKHAYASLFLISVVVFSVVEGISFQNTYSVAWNPPSSEVMQQLQWVAQHYGYDNESVVLVINGFPNFAWEAAIAGEPEYFGHLCFLLANKTENAQLYSPSNNTVYIGAMQELWVQGKIPNFQPSKYTILLTSATYEIQPAEMKILQNVGPGVYSVQKLSEAALRQWLEGLQNECS